MVPVLALSSRVLLGAHGTEGPLVHGTQAKSIHASFWAPRAAETVPEI